jgi:hypothetical protein
VTSALIVIGVEMVGPTELESVTSTVSRRLSADFSAVISAIYNFTGGRQGRNADQRAILTIAVIDLVNLRVALLQWQKPCPWAAGPINRENRPDVQLRRAFGNSSNQRLAPYFRDERLTPQQDDAGFCIRRVGKDARKIQIVRDQYESVVTGILADGRIGSTDRSHCRPVNSSITGTIKRRNPSRCQIHVDEELHPSTGQMDFAPLGKTRSKRKGFANVLLLKIWKVVQ